MNNARPNTPLSNGDATGLASLVDEALSPAHLQAIAHPQDWPDAGLAADLSSEFGGRPTDARLPSTTWDAAVGDIARDILTRPSHQFRARLCDLAWRLADGGDRSIFPALPAVVEIIHAGSLIIDDIEDGSSVRRGGPSLHVVHGVPRALNTGNWMYFWAMELVDALPLAEATRNVLRRALVDTMYRCHLGQSLDLSVAVGTLPRRWVYRTVATSTMLKTGALMELAARLAAAAAGAPAARVETLAQFGRRLGLGLQMLDDFGNLNASPPATGDSKALEDLRNGRPTWPWARAAVDLDEPTFWHLQASVRALAGENRRGGMAAATGGGRGAEADLDQGHARALAAELRMAVGLEGRRQASSYLERALAALKDEVGDRAELKLVADEISRLEASYG